MKAPHFWQSRGIIACVLWPLSQLYSFISFVHKCTRPTTRVDVPVICVGNITMGGAGKTPTVIALVKLLLQAGHTPHIISRGYGGNMTDTTRVDTAEHGAVDVGDEPLMLSLHAPVWVGADRAASAKAAQKAGASIILMDDGMQNPTLHKDATVCVIDAGYGFGNGFTFPSGPCRTSIRRGLKQSNAALVIGENVGTVESYIPNTLPIFTASITPTSQHDIAQSQWVAFAGIGRPKKFFDTLQKAGADIIAQHAFADHHPYTNTEMEALISEAQHKTASLITTRKDYMRIPDKYRAQIQVLDIELDIKNGEAMRDLLLASCQPE